MLDVLKGDQGYVLVFAVPEACYVRQSLWGSELLHAIAAGVFEVRKVIDSFRAIIIKLPKEKPLDLRVSDRPPLRRV
jgi:hypothetical protein